MKVLRRQIWKIEEMSVCRNMNLKTILMKAKMTKIEFQMCMLRQAE